MMKPGFVVVVVLGVLGLAGSAHGTVCMGGPDPLLLLSSPLPVVAMVASVGNGVQIARGDSAGSGWVATGVISGGLSIVAGVTVQKRLAKGGVCVDQQSVPFARMYVGVGVLSLALAVVNQVMPEPAMEEEPGLSLAITPWIVPMDQGSVAAGAELRVLGF